MEKTEAEKFKEFVKKLVAVPKKEIDERLKEEKEKRERRKKSAPTQDNP